MRLAVVISLVVILVGAAAFLRVTHRSTTTRFKMTDQYVQWAASEAVSDAEMNSHVKLNYSTASIKDVEKILSDLHDQYSKDPKSVSVVGLANAYGAYIGETIRRTEPNVGWESGDAVAGDKSYPLIWAPGRSYPMAWCYHRIVNGEEDNVWVKYTVLRDRAAESKSSLSSLLQK